MPQRGLRGAGRDAPFTEVRAERVPQRVHVDRAAAIVPLGDPGQLEIAVQDRAQLTGDVEHRQVAGQGSRCGVAPGGLHALLLIGQPDAQFGRQVSAQWNVGSAAAQSAEDVTTTFPCWGEALFR